jgi:hypothetical protein
MRSVVILLQLEPKFLSAVLAASFNPKDGVSWRWAQPVEVDETGCTTPYYEIIRKKWHWVQISERAAVADEILVFRVDHELLASGVQRLFMSGVLPAGNNVRAIVAAQDERMVDGRVADLLVQLSCFGSIIYEWSTTDDRRKAKRVASAIY